MIDESLGGLANVRGERPDASNENSSETSEYGELAGLEWSATYDTGLFCG